MLLGVPVLLGVPAAWAAEEHPGTWEGAETQGALRGEGTQRPLSGVGDEEEAMSCGHPMGDKNMSE